MDKKVLVVDDQANLVRLMQLGLEDEGFIVLTARDGREALSVLRAQSPDVVIMDVMMPGTDGLEALREIRSDPRIRDTPVILLTARNRDSDHVEGREMGANIYLTKPFKMHELIRWVHYYTTEQ